jgi:hypothetical protein
LLRWHAAIEGDTSVGNPLQGMWSRDLRERRRAIVREDVMAWESLKSRADWEKLRDERLEKLRRRSGTFHLHLAISMRVSLGRTTGKDIGWSVWCLRVDLVCG